MFPKLSSQVLKVRVNRHFWVVAALFALGIILHYPQQLLGMESASLFSSLGMTRHAVERVYMLLPVTYAGFIFGLKAGLVSLGVALAIMLPRIFLLSQYVPDSLLETGGVILVGAVVNVWFHFHRRDIGRRERAEALLAKIIDGSSIPAFVINKKHRVTHWNTALEALSAVKKEDVIGTEEHWRACYAEKRPVMADLIVGGATSAEVTTHYGDKYKESELIEGACEAEDWFPGLGGGGRWLHFTASPLRDSSGELIGAIETLEDVTERKIAEANLRRYLREITRAQEEERKRIARELHDETAQELVILLRQVDKLMLDGDKLSPAGAQLVEKLRDQTSKIMKGVQRFSQDLRPSALDDLGLLPALEWLTSQWTNNLGIAVDMQVEGTPRRFPPEIELVVFRIAQEALRNIWKHSGASKAWLTLEFRRDKTLLTVEDAGKGFSLPERTADLAMAGKLGLAGMQERAQLIGGSLKLKSEPGLGMKVTLEIPV